MRFIHLQFIDNSSCIGVGLFSLPVSPPSSYLAWLAKVKAFKRMSSKDPELRETYADKKRGHQK